MACIIHVCTQFTWASSEIRNPSTIHTNPLEVQAKPNPLQWGIYTSSLPNYGRRDTRLGPLHSCYQAFPYLQRMSQSTHMYGLEFSTPSQRRWQFRTSGLFYLIGACIFQNQMYSLMARIVICRSYLLQGFFLAGFPKAHPSHPKTRGTPRLWEWSFEAISSMA
jgi:hypothetical protein